MQEVRVDDRDRTRVGAEVVAEDLGRLGVELARAAAHRVDAEPLDLRLLGDLLELVDLVAERPAGGEPARERALTQRGGKARPGVAVGLGMRIGAKQLGDRAGRLAVSGPVDEEVGAGERIGPGRLWQIKRVRRVPLRAVPRCARRGPPGGRDGAAPRSTTRQRHAGDREHRDEGNRQRDHPGLALPEPLAVWVARTARTSLEIVYVAPREKED